MACALILLVLAINRRVSATVISKNGYGMGSSVERLWSVRRRAYKNAEFPTVAREHGMHLRRLQFMYQLSRLVVGCMEEQSSSSCTSTYDSVP